MAKLTTAPRFLIIVGLCVLLLVALLGIVLYETSDGEPTDTWERPFSGERININTATASELMELDGMRKEVADRIVKYRKRNVRFATIEELEDLNEATAAGRGFAVSGGVAGA